MRRDLHHLVDALPEDVLRRIEHGGPVTLVVTRENGQLALHEIDPDQAWFWTPEWQAGEQEADAEIAASRVTRFLSDDELLAALEADLEPLAE